MSAKLSINGKEIVGFEDGVNVKFDIPEEVTDAIFQTLNEQMNSGSIFTKSNIDNSKFDWLHFHAGDSDEHTTTFTNEPPKYKAQYEGEWVGPEPEYDQPQYDQTPTAQKIIYIQERFPHLLRYDASRLIRHCTSFGEMRHMLRLLKQNLTVDQILERRVG